MLVNEELDRRLPTIEPFAAAPKPNPIPHNEARGRGRSLSWAWFLLVGILSAMSLAVAALLLRCDLAGQAPQAEAKKGMDGSTAGANAASIYDVEWEAGEHSVTSGDLERGYEFGQAYPSNGKGAPLVSDTTYGKGAGMVDVVTFDSATNVEVRHYGQMQKDGTVRWYAAETVLDSEGMPVCMERE